MEVLLGSDDVGGELAEAYGYVNRALPDAELDAFVDALATRISTFDKWAISNTKRLVNANSSAPEVEMAAGWEACIASVERPTTQARFKAFRELGWHKPGEAENRLGSYLTRINR
jgi:enoyl-CoA hydratase/carnithine racemase